jgi:hypothetical protein
MLIMNVLKFMAGVGGWERNILYSKQSLHVSEVIKCRV